MESSFPGLSVLLSPLPVLPVLPPSGSLSMTVFSLRLAPQTVHSSCLEPLVVAVASLSITHLKVCAAVSFLSPQGHSCQWLSASDFQSAPWLWICGILLYVTITVLSASMITSSVLERTSTLTPFTVTVSIS